MGAPGLGSWGLTPGLGGVETWGAPWNWPGVGPGGYPFLPWCSRDWGIFSRRACLGVPWAPGGGGPPGGAIWGRGIHTGDLGEILGRAQNLGRGGPEARGIKTPGGGPHGGVVKKGLLAETTVLGFSPQQGGAGRMVAPWGG